MNACLALPIFTVLNLAFAMTFSLAHGWCLGRPVAGWYVAPIFICLQIRYYRLGMRFMMNFAVTLTIVNCIFVWMEWREPYCIAMEKLAKGDALKGKAILDRAIRNQPDKPVLAAAFQQALLSGNSAEMTGTISELRSQGVPDAAIETLESYVALTTLPAEQAMEETRRLRDKNTAAIARLQLYGRACLTAGYHEDAATAFQSVIDKCGTLKALWLFNTPFHVEVWLNGAEARLCLAHIERVKGETAKAKELALNAVDDFYYATVFGGADAPQACTMLLQQRTTGNLVAAWALALADRAETDALKTRIKVLLGKLEVDVAEYVKYHLDARTIPSYTDDLAAVRMASN